MALASGSVLAGRYRIVKRLGEGGMGDVYAVEDSRRAGAMYALKVLLDDASLPIDERAAAVKRFDDEIALLRQFRHPRIPRYIDGFVDTGRRCFVMELISGETLETRLDAARAPLPERDVLSWMCDVCDVLTYLHTKHPPIIVRDLKPGNIMVTPSGEVRLIDFGIARTYKPGKLGNTENLGTAIYASPEHHGHGQTDARSDIYSLGATMYHLLTRVEPPPMETPAPGLLRRLRPALSAATEQIIIRAMQLDPSRRYHSADEMRIALQQALRALPAPQVRKSPVPIAARATPTATVVAPVPPAPASNGRSPAQSSGSGAAQTPARKVACPRCGYLNRAGAKFCPRDGTPLRPGTQPQSRPGGAPAAQGTPAVTRIVPAITTAALHAQRATESFSAGRYQQAVRQAERALAQGRGTAELYVLLGKAYRQLHRAGDAARAFAEAARLQPDAQTLDLEGQAQREAGNLVEAQVAWTKARTLDPRNADIPCQLGLLCLEQGLLAQAEGDLTEALALQPALAPALAGMGRLHLARKRWTEAVEYFRRATAANPSDAAAYTGLARALRELGKRGDARTAAKRALSLDATNQEARSLLAQL